MSGLVRVGLIFGVGAVLAFIAALLLPLGGLQIILAFISVLIVGVGAGYTAAKKTSAARGGGRGAAAGAIAGVVVLIISIVAFALLANTEPVQQAMAQAMQQSGAFTAPNNTQPPSPGPAGAALIGGSGAGFCLGLLLLVLMLIGGAIGGALWRGVPSVANTGEGAYGSTPLGTASDPDRRRSE